MKKLRHWFITVSGLPRRRRSRAVLAEVRAEHAERLIVKPLELAQFGASFEFPDPGSTRWPQTCVLDDPCGVKFDNDADRSYWFECLNQRSRGRHSSGRMYV